MVGTPFKMWRLVWQAPLVLILMTGRAGAAPIPDQDCVIEPHTVIDLASAVEGIVESVEVARGDLVERDQVLVKLDAGVERAAVDYARARAEASAQVRAGEANASFAQRRAGRVGTLYEQKVVSSDQMDEAATQTRLTKAQADQATENRRLAQLELKQAQEYLARHVIRSPIRGVVVQDYLSPGESVKDKPILRLAEIDPLRVEVIVPVAYFGAIVPGQSATIHPEAPREGDFTATVSIVDRVADAASGTFRVRLTLPNKDYSLPSGLKCRVAFNAAPPAPGVKAASASAPVPVPVSALAPAEFLPALPPATPGGRTRGVRRVAAASNVREVSPRQDARTISRAVPVVAARHEEPSLPKCHTIGPLASVAQADQLKDVFVDRVDRLSVRASTSDKPSEYVILSEARSTGGEAELLAASLREAGIRDLHVYKRGPWANRIALGIYAGPVRAETRRTELAALGIAAEVVPRSAKEQQLWLDMESVDTASAVEALNRTLASVAPDMNLFPVPCNRLFVARQ